MKDRRHHPVERIGARLYATALATDAAHRLRHGTTATERRKASRLLDRLMAVLTENLRDLPAA